jgi:hypothetical protein
MLKLHRVSKILTYVTGLRKALQQAPLIESSLSSTSNASAKTQQARHPDESVSLQQLVQDHVTGRQRMLVEFELPQSRFEFWSALETLGGPQSIFAYWAELRAQRKRELTTLLPSQPQLHAIPHLDRSSRSAQATSVQSIDLPDLDLARNTPCVSSAFEFPLSADHRLFVLIQYNALQGCMTNMSIILNLQGRPLEGWEDFYTEGLPTPPDNAPSSLHPTSLQKTVPHEAWVDIIPYAMMRDNILRDHENIDDDALCDDFLGGMHEGLSEVESRGLILWGDPWSEDGWEISEGFARKWSFFLKGCDSLVRSTNRWRETRGEERLVVEV